MRYKKPVTASFSGEVPGEYTRMDWHKGVDAAHRLNFREILDKETYLLERRRGTLSLSFSNISFLGN